MACLMVIFQNYFQRLRKFKKDLDHDRHNPTEISKYKYKTLSRLAVRRAGRIVSRAANTRHVVAGFHYSANVITLTAEEIGVPYTSILMIKLIIESFVK